MTICTTARPSIGVLRGRLKARSVLLFALALVGFLWLPASAHAGCTSTGCFGMLIEHIIVDANDRIWLVMDQSADLTNLIPSPSCTVKQVWTGQAEYALYISPADTARNELYATALTAFTKGYIVGFTAETDPVTGWCSLGKLDIKK